MKRAEEDAQEASPFPLPLSTYMRESWDTGRFWLSYGARKSWVFDMAYWRFLDERFFGEREEDVLQSHLWKTRVHLLTDEERDAMEDFVSLKMKESLERKIVDRDPAESVDRFSQFLFD